MITDYMTQMDARMNGAIEALKRDFNSLRTGRASTALLDHVMVEAYGSSMPLSQVGTISVPESRMLSVQVWDKTMIKNVEKALLESGLGLNPVVDGQLIRLPLPSLNEERRRELTKIAAKYVEAAKIAVRNIRRDAIDYIKAREKAKDISEDDERRYLDTIQKATDSFINKIDELGGQKEKDIMTV